MEKEFVDLLELQRRLRQGVELLFPSRIWVRAEVGAVKARNGGHCYLELSLLLLHTQRILRINIIDDQRQAIKFTIIDLHFNKNHHSLLDRRTGHGLEVWRYETIF